MTVRYRAEWLLTNAGSDLIGDGCVDVDDGRVTYSGAADRAPDRRGEVVAVSGLLIPGLVNVHCHTPMVLLRGAGEGLPVERWLREVMWPREGRLTPDDVYWGMTLGAAELLRNGVTTSCEMYFHGAEMAQAAHDAGLRSMIAPPLMEETAARDESIDEQLEAVVQLAEDRRDDPLISVALGPHSVYALSEGALRGVAEVARGSGLPVHLHVGELPDENDLSRERHGVAVVPFLERVGMFATHLIVGHGIWLDDDDRRTLAGHSVGIAHCPTSNLRHASGIADVVAHRDHGIPVGIGTDGAASAPTLDPFTEMRLAIGLARVRALDAEALTIHDVLTMATSEGARVLGLPDIGSLDPGCHADMVNIDIDGSAFHPVVDPGDVLTHLVWSGTPTDVRHVWVGGTQVVRDREPCAVDVDRAIVEVDRRARRLAEL